MEHRSDFEYDLKLAKIAELRLAEILQGKTIELKTDYAAKRTGNVFIEFESRGKASGIARSTAEYYAFEIVGGPVIITEASKLKNICRKYLGTSRETVGGDNNTSKGILLPVTDLLL